MPGSILEFDNIERSYSTDRQVLKGVSFSLSQGEAVSLLGRNGAGKTTLIRIAMGLLFPHSGSVRVFGLSPTADPVGIKKRVGFVAEDQELPGKSSIEELIAFYRYLFPRWDTALERQVMERFGFSGKSVIVRLSKGEKRAVALLLAVCHRPELLILDEPAAGLDPAARRDFLEVAIQLLNREGSTILFSSHYMNDVERVGNRAVVLDDGKVRLDSSIDQLREEYCLAIIPLNGVSDAQQLKQIPGCLRVRQAADTWRVVFAGSPYIIESRLTKSVNAKYIRCATVPLEELFVELMGHTPETQS